VLILIAKEQNLTEVAVGIGFDVRDAVQHGALKIELDHDADGLGEPGIHADWEIEGADGEGRAPVRPRCQRRRGLAFIGAQRRPLTEEADGAGAGFAQEGQQGLAMENRLFVENTIRSGKADPLLESFSRGWS